MLHHRSILKPENFSARTNMEEKSHSFFAHASDNKKERDRKCRIQLLLILHV